MNEQEKKLLIEDIYAQIMKDLTGKDYRAQNEASKPLRDVYEKYRDDLYNKFGTYIWSEIWNNVRRLSVFRTGKRYVRDLLPSEEIDAAEYAEDLLIIILGE